MSNNNKASWTLEYDPERAVIEEAQKESSEKSPLKKIDIGTLNIIEWHADEFMEKDSQKAIFESNSHGITIELSDYESIDYVKPNPHPGPATQIHLTGEVMPYETYMFVTSITKDLQSWAKNITITLSRYEAETTGADTPIKIKLNNIYNIAEGKYYLNILKNIQIGDFLNLKAELVEPLEE